MDIIQIQDAKFTFNPANSQHASTIIAMANKKIGHLKPLSQFHLTTNIFHENAKALAHKAPQ